MHSLCGYFEGGSMLKFCVMVFGALLQLGMAHAETGGKRDVEVSLQQFSVSSAGQVAVLGATGRVKPGEVIEYQVVYHNVSGHSVRQVNATLPIPKDTEYVPESAKPRNVLASVDNLNYAPLPLRRSVKLPNGRVEEQLVPIVEYRSLRWVLGDFSVNQKVTVSARVRLVPLGDVKVKK